MFIIKGISTSTLEKKDRRLDYVFERNGVAYIAGSNPSLMDCYHDA